MDCSPPGSSVHGIFQARILEWVAIAFPRGSSWPRGWTRVSCIAGRFLTVCERYQLLSSFSLRWSWFLVCWAIFCWKLDIWGVPFRDSVSYFNLFSLASSDTVGEGVGGRVVVAMSCLVSAKWGGSLGLSLASVDIGGRGLLLTAGWEEKFSSLPRPRPPLIAPPWGGVRVLRCHSPCGLVAPRGKSIRTHR